MKTTFLIEAAFLILLGGLVLFGAGYFLPEQIALQGTTFIGGLMGFIIFIRSTNWPVDKWFSNVVLLFCITLLMSLWASLCSLGVCYLFQESSFCDRENVQAFIMLDFFFPILIAFFSWVAYRRSQSP